MYCSITHINYDSLTWKCQPSQICLWWQKLPSSLLASSALNNTLASLDSEYAIILLYLLFFRCKSSIWMSDAETQYTKYHKQPASYLWSQTLGLAHCICLCMYIHTHTHTYILGVPGGKDNILEGHSIGHSKQKTLYEHVSYSQLFPR
jgi:hypothetical protein